MSLFLPSHVKEKNFFGWVLQKETILCVISKDTEVCIIGWIIL